MSTRIHPHHMSSTSRSQHGPQASPNDHPVLSTCTPCNSLFLSSKSTLVASNTSETETQILGEWQYGTSSMHIELCD